MSSNVHFESREAAFNVRLRTFALVNRGHIDVKQFLEESFEYFENEIRSALQMYLSVKVNVCLLATFEKTIINNDDANQIEAKKEKQDLYIQTKNVVIERDTCLRTLYEEEILNIILTQIENAIIQGSGFTLSSIEELSVQINRFDPLRASSYIKLPKFLADKKAIVNVQNKDDKCFMWAILAALHKNDTPKNAERVYSYLRYRNELNFKGVEFPVRVDQIEKFEKMNESISINVYMFDSKTKKVQPLRISKMKDRQCIHLLLLNAVEGAGFTPHYCWISNLSRLISAQLTNHHGKTYLCDRCLNYFWSSEKLEDHIINCVRQNECQIKMPVSGKNIIEFKNYKNQVVSPFIIYADVEALLKKPTEIFCNSDKTKAFQEHEVYSVGFYLKCSYNDSKSYYRARRGSDCLEWFVKELELISHTISNDFDNIVPLKMSTEDEIDFLRASKCHICEKKFIKHADTIVRDHCHFTGKFRGAAHQECNLQYRDYRTIPVVFHNLTHYDSHFIIEKIASGFEGGVKIIPINTEKYISFIKTVPHSSGKYKEMIKLKFIDSFRFMASSLDELSSFLPSEKKSLLRDEFKNMTDGQIKLLERKGVFCYDYVDSWEKLEETALPPKEAFFSKLTCAHISDIEYEFAKEVWEKFSIKTLGDYADLYLHVDVCLLAIVFENFRETSYKLYKLDPANYYTAPGLSFDAMLRHTKVKLELLTDIDMLLFIERGIRGGISQCSRRYVVANNKYMTTFDKDKKNTFIMYEDCNNLYGFVMRKKLPTGGYQWVENHQFTHDEILNLSDDADIGYYFEVDLEYPEHLHDLHNDYPFCAENIYTPNKKNSKKLMLTLSSKKNYVVHYSMLKLAMQHGLVLKIIHRVLKFKQSAWLKPYIEVNTKMRAKATNDFEKNYYKLMNNAVFGKCMENVRKRLEILLRTSWDGRYGARKLIAAPNFKKRTIFNENLVAVEMLKTNILMDKPIAVGMAILDLSKVVMYDYYYNFLKDKKYGDKIKLAYTDTDSFVFQVETDDYYEDMKKNLEWYDTSDYLEDNIYQMPRVNKKVLGLFKDELKGELITEFVGLRSKMYSVRTAHEDKMKKAKGVKEYVVKKHIKFKDYKDCLENHSIIIKDQNSFRTKLHRMYTIQQTKIALSPDDDKRYIMRCDECKTGACASCNFETLAHGHYKIKYLKGCGVEIPNHNAKKRLQSRRIPGEPKTKHPRMKANLGNE